MQSKQYVRLSLLIFINLLFQMSIAAEKDLSLAADPWCPFTCDSTEENKGIFYDVINDILATNGHAMRYEILAWSRAVDETRQGNINGVLGALKADAPDFLFPQTAVAEQKTCFYKKNNSDWKYKNKQSLNKISLGITNEYRYGEPLDSLISAENKFTKVSGTNTAEKLIQLLEEKRIDVFAEDKSVYEFLISKNSKKNPNFAKDIINAGCLKPVPLHIAFSPKFAKAKEIIKIIDRDLPKFKKSEKWQSILKKYRN